ncbi:MAG: hypothetical protein COW71_01480 [Ignavibacteriales bacterium CG18_big_fil_WC_8_21_14_2_50_31_20]|nr:MAG: hypothetical protein COW71_01480 [Ignavibacteriales bacterium CG18_big_fil_WC_8_21_14_2_50_31_20]
MQFERTLGFDKDGNSVSGNKKQLIQYINLKLAAKGYPFYGSLNKNKFLEIAEDLISNNQEKERLLSKYFCPADFRIQKFLDKYFSTVIDTENIQLPHSTFELDRHGIARILSISPDSNKFESDIISSYRLKQGVLHNPKNDRRTTKGVFHIAEGGLPIPDDKIAVPLNVAANLLEIALKPPTELLKLPYTANEEKQAQLFVSLLLRPKVSPEVPGYLNEKSMEIRFFAPGNLVSNLDFVESIFGNAGNPFLPQNDAALDSEHWNGHTGSILLAPHIIGCLKKELGLPNKTNATERQLRDGMYWEKENELYNNGKPFKLTIRNSEGIIFTIIADNYFGYSKKEVKTQISFSANLFGNCEEEHSGGALAFPSYSQTEAFHNDENVPKNNHSFEQVINMYSEIMELHDDGYGVDKLFSNIIYVPENVEISIKNQKVFWLKNGYEKSIKLLPNNVYILPEGYKIRMEKKPNAPSWRLVGTVPEGTLCHKPSTVSGGGKSEISKSISDSILSGPFFVADFEKDFKLVEEIINKDYGLRFLNKANYSPEKPSRKLLSQSRSLGSVIKLLTPSPNEYTEEFNNWLESIPQYIKGFVLIIKRFYKLEWGDNWKEHFSVDTVDGKLGHELQYHNRPLVANYLRVGFEKSGAWRTFKLRQDFVASEKIQVEDDITVSTVVPTNKLEYLNNNYTNRSLKFVDNCEYRFFQRPDEAINRGYDKQAEIDLSSPNSFISNFEPLTVKDAKELLEDAIGFDKFSKPMQDLIREVAKGNSSEYFISSAHPRIVDGAPSKNVRYLQNRPDIKNPFNKYVAEIATRFFRKIPLNKPVLNPVNAVLPGRRNNPKEPGIRPLSVFNPIHYQELPELFMDFISSLTGKSPSTTGVGSEGALTKAPFNALLPVTDLNNALLSFILTGYNAFSTAAGFIGNIRIDHDISLLIPEIWSRLSVYERNPSTLIRDGFLEKINDFEYNDETILACRLGYRITNKFVKTYFGRVFENPNAVFSTEILKPETQDIETFVDGIKNIVEAHKNVAESYFRDGSVEAAIPPLKAILYIMVYGKYEGKNINNPEIRDLFNRENVIKSDWYISRLKAKQDKDIALFNFHIKNLNLFITKKNYSDVVDKLEIKNRLQYAKTELTYLQSQNYFNNLVGTLGLDLVYK